MPGILLDIIARDRASGPIDHVGKKTAEAGKKTEEWAKRTKTAAAAAGVGVVLFAKSAISAASDMNETQSKSTVIFGKNASAIDKWASGAAKSMGLSKQAAIESAASFGDMFSQIGFSGDATAKMSQTVVQLSADLGSFNNLPTAEVTEMISAAFRGEYDSLQRVIPNISAARVQQEALNETHKKSVNDLTAAEKATATLTIIQKDGARASGDFARTSSGLANQTKIARAEFDNLQASIGTKLIPVMTTALGIGLKTAEWMDHNRGLTIALGGAVLGLVVAVKAVHAAQAVWGAGSVVVAASQKLIARSSVEAAVGMDTAAVSAKAAALGIGGITAVAAVALLTIWELKKALEEGPKDHFSKIINPIKYTGEHLGKTSSKADELTKSADDLTKKLLGGLKPAATGAATATKTVADAADEAMKKMITENDAAGLLTAGLDKLNGKNISAAEASLQFSDGLDGLVHKFDAARKNGDAYSTSLNTNTAAGRDNYRTVLDSIKAATTHAAAIGAQTGSSVRAAAAMRTDEDAIRAAAKAAGLNVGEVNRMIVQYGKVPPIVKTNVDLRSDSAQAKADHLAAQLRLLDGRSFTAYLNVQTSINKLNAFEARAGGGPVTKGRPYVVGDGGRPELFVPDQNGTILPSVPTARGAAASGSAAQSVVFDFSNSTFLGTQSDVTRWIVEGIDQARKRRGSKKSVLD